MKNIEYKNFTNTIRSLNPKEVHRWPLAVSLFLGSLLFMVIIAAATAGYLMGQYDQWQGMRAKEERLKSDFLDKKKQAVNLPLYKKQLEEVTLASDLLLKQLPNRSELDHLLVDINQAALSRGLQIELFKPSQEKINDFYAELPISLKLNGSYESIGKFASDVSTLSRVVLLKDIKLTKRDTGLSLEATAKTFRYLDQEELDKQRIAKEKAKKQSRSKNGKKETASAAKAK